MRVFAKGDRVSQLQYGTGTVTEANERHTVIDFDEHGIRTFSTPIVTLERTTIAAPAKTRKPSRARRARQAEA
jgi:hypothetical protein